MRVRTTVTAPLCVTKVLLALLSAVDTSGGKRCNFIGQKVRKVRTLHLFWNFRLGLVCGVNHQWIAFDQRPFN